MNKDKKRGFTLVELLVVVSIIGLLATIVLGSLSDARKKAKNATIRSHFSQLKIALELYHLDHGTYPNSIALTPSWCSDSGNYGGTPCSDTTGPTGWIPGLAPDYIGELRSDLVSGTPGATWMYRGNSTGYKVMLHAANVILDEPLANDDPMRGDNAGGTRDYTLIICENISPGVNFCDD